MKRIFTTILTLLLLVACFSSCGSEDYDVYSSFIADSVNNEFGLDVEVDFWTGTYFEKGNMTDKSCSVRGKSYTGSYSKSIINKMNSYTTDIYLDENNIEFGLRSDNGELAYINLMNAEFFDTEPYLQDINNPYESAIQLATVIAQDYVDDITDYTQINEEPVTRYKERDGMTYEITYYVVTFARKINGYFSSDYIAVKVTSKGNLASIMIGDINAFDSVTIDFDSAVMNKSISTKIKSSYKEGEFNVRESNIDNQKIVLTPTGNICMYSDVVIEGTDCSNAEAKTGISIITILGKKQ